MASERRANRVERTPDDIITPTMDVSVLVPIYNDWESLSLLLPALNAEVTPTAHVLHLVVIDDGSTDRGPEEILDPSLTAFSSESRLRLKSNLGHQRAIATGLSWISSNTKTDAVVVMDGDGEDKPSDVPRLLEAFLESKTAVFAERARRSESTVFKVFYFLYRWMHLIATGLPVKIGNFSILSPADVQGLVVSNYLWYHYAATVVRTRTPYRMIGTARGDRYRGASKMNFVAFVRHGLSAIAVHSEVLSVRLLIVCGVLTCLCLGALGACLWTRLFTQLAIPGWATMTSGLIVIFLLQLLSVAFIFVMQSVSIHGSAGFLPVRDSGLFLLSVQQRTLRTAAMDWTNR